MPPKAAAPEHELSSLDAAFVLQSVVRLRTLTAHQALAGDVTGNGQISSLDASRILQFVVGHIDRFPVAERCGSDWVFEPSPTQMPNQSLASPQISSGSCSGGRIAFDPLSGSATGQDFTALLFGDLTGNWAPSIAPAAALSRQRLEPGETVVVGRMRRSRRGQLSLPIAVRSGRSFSSVDVVLEYDPKEIRIAYVQSATVDKHDIIAWKDDHNGRVSVSLAAASPWPRGTRTLFTVTMEGNRRNRTPLAATYAALDEKQALLEQP